MAVEADDDRPVTEVELRAADGIEESIAWSTVGIVCGSGDVKGKGIGSGIALRWNGHHVIVTAAHVMEGTRTADLRFMFRPRGPLQRIERSALVNAVRIPTASLERVKQIRLDEPLIDATVDLAAIPVDAELEQEQHVRFFDLTSGGTTPPVGHAVIVRGYPADITRVTQQNERVAFTTTEWTRIEPNRGALSGFDPARQLLIAYAMRTSAPNAMPHGLSGSAVWYRRGPTPIVWHSNLDIAGVTVSFYSRPNLLGAVRREALEAFLAAHVG